MISCMSRLSSALGVQDGRYDTHVPALQKALTLSFVPLCRRPLLYQSMKRGTHWHARVGVVNPLLGNFGQYFKVQNNDSKNVLSLLTRGRLCEAMMFEASSFALKLSLFIGAPSSACSTSGWAAHRWPNAVRLSGPS